MSKLAAVVTSLVALLVLVAAPALAAPVASVFGGRVPCIDLGTSQFCSGTLLTRVESFDGVPLDVNVTLPPASSVNLTPPELPISMLPVVVQLRSSAGQCWQSTHTSVLADTATQFKAK